MSVLPLELQALSRRLSLKVLPLTGAHLPRCLPPIYTSILNTLGRLRGRLSRHALRAYEPSHAEQEMQIRLQESLERDSANRPSLLQAHTSPFPADLFAPPRQGDGIQLDIITEPQYSTSDSTWKCCVEPSHIVSNSMVAQNIVPQIPHPSIPSPVRTDTETDDASPRDSSGHEADTRAGTRPNRSRTT